MFDRVSDLLVSPLLHEGVTRAREHRPWPMPHGSWVMAQTWVDLLFAHWSMRPGALEPVVPPQLALDTFEGRAWLGVTPFEVRHLRLRPVPPMPWVSDFPEVNVRTYVSYRGRPGIYFFSLDAARILAVLAARRFYRLPYFHAGMRIERSGTELSYRSDRHDAQPQTPPASLRIRYRGLDPIDPGPGSLERWLTERYCLYTLDDRQRVLTCEIHHPPWRLQHVDVEWEENSMGAQIGIRLQEDPLVHYSQRQDVVFWPLRLADD